MEITFQPFNGLDLRVLPSEDSTLHQLAQDSFLTFSNGFSGVDGGSRCNKTDRQTEPQVGAPSLGLVYPPRP